MNISPLPAPPMRSDPTNFSDRADAFLGALPLFATQANELLAEAQAAALTAVNAPGTSATSTTPLAIGTGAKDMVIQAGKAFTIGQFVILASTAGPSNYMIGQITAHDSASGALSVSAGSVNGSGTFSDWAIALAPATMMAGDGVTVQEKLDALEAAVNARPTTEALATGPNTFGPISVSSAIETTPPGNFSNDSTGSAVQGLICSIGKAGGNANNTSSFHFLGVTQGVALWYLYGNGTISYSSDRRLKKNIEPARQDYLADYLQLGFYKYNMRTDADGAPRQLGVIADQAREVFPSLVETAMHKLYGPGEDPENPDAGEYYDVFKYSVLPLITGCVVQELGRKCLALEETVAALEARIAVLEAA